MDTNPCHDTMGAPRQRFTLKKAEKLRHRSLVEGLFREGSSIYEFPIRLMWRKLDSEKLSNSFKSHTPAGIDKMQMLITVPKKKRKRAVDRVLMRRRIREAYRLNRHRLRQAIDSFDDMGTLSMAFIYMHNENLNYDVIERKMKLLLYKLKTKIEGE